MKLPSLAVGFLTILSATFFSEKARADFIPPYDVPTGFLRPFTFADGSKTAVGSWTLQTSGTPFVYPNALVQYDPSRLLLQTDGTLQLGSSPNLKLEFTHPILATGTLSFDYTLSLGSPAFPGFNYGGYLLNGNFTLLTPGTGSVTLRVPAGTIFGFEAFGSGNCINCSPAFVGATTLTITNFVAPVPEPATTSLLICGAGLALGRARARLRRSGRDASLKRS